MIVVKTFKGVGASRGIAQGKVTIFAENISYPKNVILVAEYIPPSITNLDNNIIGIVTEDGGILSHAACIARELQLPCIVGIKNAIEVLEGQTITINGETGVVEIENN